MDVKQHNLAVISKIIRKTRKLQGLSQEEIALRAGLGLSYYGRVERGQQNLSILNLIRIAFALEVELYELLPRLKSLQKE